MAVFTSAVEAPDLGVFFDGESDGDHFSWVDQRTKWAILSILNNYVTLPEAL